MVSKKQKLINNHNKFFGLEVQTDSLCSQSKLPDKLPDNFNDMFKLNNQFNKIFKNITRDKLFINDTLTPSIISKYNKYLKITPSCNSKIKRLFDNHVTFFNKLPDNLNNIFTLNNHFNKIVKNVDNNNSFIADMLTPSLICFYNKYIKSTSLWNSKIKQLLYNYFKFFNKIPTNFNNMLKLNKQFDKIFENIHRDKLFIDDMLIPSIVGNYNKDITITPFWNSKIKQLSDKLFLPEYDDFELSAFNGNPLSNTWFNSKRYINPNTNTYKLKLKKEAITIKTVKKCKQIRLNLTNKQTKHMRHIFGAYRYFYNRCASYVNNYDKKTKSSWFLMDYSDKKTRINITNIDKPFTFYNVRALLKPYKPDWLMNDYPSHLIDKAFNECITQFKTCLKKYKKKRTIFRFKYKNRHKKKQTIQLEKEMIGGQSQYNGIFVGMKINDEYLFRYIKTNEQIKEYDHIGSSLSYNRIFKTYTLNLNYNSKSKPTHPTNKKDICSIDPGTRTPFAIYSQKEIMMIGEDASDKLYKICKEIDIIKSRMSKKQYYVKKWYGSKQYIKVTNKRKKSLRLAMHRKIQYIQNSVKELHYKTIKYLCDNYSTIIVPPFETSKMAKLLNSKIARSMYTLSFYKFRMRLIDKAKEKHINVIVKSEAFTSKTCGKCGKLHHKLGSNKVFKCPNTECKITLERDVNGARNILLRNMHFA